MRPDPGFTRVQREIVRRLVVRREDERTVAGACRLTPAGLELELRSIYSKTGTADVRELAEWYVTR